MFVSKEMKKKNSYILLNTVVLFFIRQSAGDDSKLKNKRLQYIVLSSVAPYLKKSRIYTIQQKFTQSNLLSGCSFDIGETKACLEHYLITLSLSLS